MNIKRKPYSAKGAVLIMVLTVMFVLIFLLAGAVAVVYTSNNRVMMQYEESQAYYTARSVLDIYHGMIISDKDTSITGTYYDLESDKSKQKSYSTMTSGRALELDLYRVPVAMGTDPSLPTYNPYVAKDLRNVASADKPKYLYQRNLTGEAGQLPTTDINYGNYNKQYSVDVTKNNFKTRIANWNDTEKDPKSNKGVRFGIDDTLVYYVNYDSSTNSSKFYHYQTSKTGSADPDASNKLIDKGSLVKLTVQVLDRKYSFDEDYLTAYANVNDASKPDITWQSEFVNAKSRADDYFMIKVTSEVRYDDQVVTTSVVYRNQEESYPVTPASKAIVSMSDISGANSLLAFGGASALAWKDAIVTANNMNTEGNVFIQSGLTTGTTDMNVYLDENSYLFVRGELNINNKFIQSQHYKSGAVIYAGSIDITPANTGVLGGGTSGNQALNIVSPYLKFSSTNNIENAIVGRGFFEEIDLSAFGNTPVGDDKVKTVFGKNSGDTGNYYCDWLIVPQSWISGDTLVAELNTNHKTFGDMINGTLTVAKGLKYDNGGTMQEVPMTNGQSYFSGKLKVDSSKEFHIKYDPYTEGATTKKDFNYTSDFQKEFTLPDNLAGKTTNKLTLDTVRSLYGQYFKDDDGATPAVPTWDDSEYGDFTGYSTMDETTFKNFVKSHVKTAEDIDPDLNNKTGLAQIDYTSLPKASEVIEGFDLKYLGKDWKVISSSGFIKAEKHQNDNENYNYVIDATTSPVTIQFGTSSENSGDVSFCDNFVVYGQKQVTVIIPSTTAGTKVKFNNSDFGRFRFLHESLIDHSTLKTKDIVLNGSTATKAPNIKWLVSSDIEEIRFDQAVGDSAIHGFFTCPKTLFYQSNFEEKPNVYSEAFGLTNNIRDLGIAVVGSVLCNQFKQDVNKKAGVCYIQEDAGDGGASPGKPLFNWPAEYYSMQ